jgi:hypothetical protein
MRKLLIALLAVALAVPALGCGASERDRGINKDRDKPRAPTPDTPAK